MAIFTIRNATLLYLLCLVTTCCCAQASLWPQPLQQTSGAEEIFVQSGHFRFSSRGWNSEILDNAFERYSLLLFGSESKSQDEKLPEPGASDQFLDDNLDESSDKKHRITQLRVTVEWSDQSLGLQTNEEYSLNITKPHSVLQAKTVYGALRGLETFAQLLLPSHETNQLDESKNYVSQGVRKHKKVLYKIKETSIFDAPRFQHRGLLIDTARHFLPLSIIYEHLDAMAMTKLNVLHWHIVDDQSFPYASKILPRLSKYGAFSSEQVYTLEDIGKVVKYARDRGIRVIPEFDTPGHTLSWGKGYPELLADCYDDTGKLLSVKGPMDPTSKATYSALWKLLQEVGEVFPEKYIHLGGDEVPLECWNNNPSIQKWMSQQDPAIKDMPSLEQLFERRVLDLAKSAAKQYIIWQEIVDNGVQVQHDTVVHVWKWWWPTTPSPPDTIEASPHAKDSAPLLEWWDSLQKSLQDLFAFLYTSRGLDEEGKQASKLEKKEGSRASLLGDLRVGRSMLLDRHAKEAVALPVEDDFNHACSVSKGCMPPDGFEVDPPAWTKEMQRVTAKGHKTLLSSPWYLNLGGFASNDWAKYYQTEPLGFDASTAQKDLVIGGEACMWGEFVDETNAIQRTWPRAAAVGERLWSSASVRDVDDAFARLKEHRCRMVARGIGAEPLGPGSC